MPTKPIVKIRNEIGYAFIAMTGKRSLSSHSKPSSAVVLENGIPLPGPANAFHDEIRRLGGGRYSFWKGSVYFSTPDNSDPRTNGRQYAFAYARPIWSLAKPLRRFASPFRKSATILNRVLQREQRSEAFWGTLYWICFAYIAWCRKRFIWIKEGRYANELPKLEMHT